MTPDESAIWASAEAFLRTHAVLREQLGKDIVGDPVLEIVLHLFAARREGRLATKSMLQERLTVSPVTADRYLNLLEARGIVIQRDEGHGESQATLTLSDRGMVLLGLAFSHCS